MLGNLLFFFINIFQTLLSLSSKRNKSVSLRASVLTQDLHSRLNLEMTNVCSHTVWVIVRIIYNTTSSALSESRRQGPPQKWHELLPNPLPHQTPPLDFLITFRFERGVSVAMLCRNLLEGFHDTVWQKLPHQPSPYCSAPSRTSAMQREVIQRTQSHHNMQVKPEYLFKTLGYYTPRKMRKRENERGPFIHQWVNMFHADIQGLCWSPRRTIRKLTLPSPWALWSSGWN